MSHKHISGLKTVIRKKRQLAVIELNDNQFVFLPYNNIRQNTGLEVSEIELLIGSKLRIDFYKLGEVMFNGTVCNKDNLIVKEYFIELEKPLKQLRLDNQSQLKPFKKIKDLYYFHKFDRDNVGIKLEDESVIFISLKRFKFQSQLEKSEQHILIGSYILPDYYKQGDKLPSGDLIKHSKVLRWLNLRYSGSIETMHEKFENSIGYFDGDNFTTHMIMGRRAMGIQVGMTWYCMKLSMEIQVTIGI